MRSDGEDTEWEVDIHIYIYSCIYTYILIYIYLHFEIYIYTYVFLFQGLIDGHSVCFQTVMIPSGGSSSYIYVSFVSVCVLCGSPVWPSPPVVGPLWGPPLCVGPLLGPLCGSPVWVPCVGPSSRRVASCGIYSRDVSRSFTLSRLIWVQGLTDGRFICTPRW